MQGEMCEREGGGSFLKARAALAGVDLADQDEEHASAAKPTTNVSPAPTSRKAARKVRWRGTRARRSLCRVGRGT